MPNQVFKYKSRKDYLTPGGKGEPVSEAFGSWDEAAAVRDALRAENPSHYYNICHFTAVAVIDSEVEV